MLIRARLARAADPMDAERLEKELVGVEGALELPAEALEGNGRSIDLLRRWVAR